MFSLGAPVVHRVISKMMIKDELLGAWDQPSGAIVMQSVEPSRLQKSALYYADKAALFVDQNERLMQQDGRGGGGYYRGNNDRGNWKGNRNNNRDNNNNRGNNNNSGGGGGYRG